MCKITEEFLEGVWIFKRGWKGFVKFQGRLKVEGLFDT